MPFNLFTVILFIIVNAAFFVIFKKLILYRIKEEPPIDIINYSYLPGYICIDVREQKEYYNEHLAKSVNIPFSRLKNIFKNIPQEKTIIFICQTGKVSKEAIRFLQKNGYTSLINLKGGIDAWKKAGYPLEYGGEFL